MVFLVFSWQEKKKGKEAFLSEGERWMKLIKDL